MLEEKMKETREEVFWKYAKPCVFFLHNRIPDETYEQLKKYRDNDIVPSWKLIESGFINAMPQYKIFTQKYDLDEESPDTARRFWLEWHNTYAKKECQVKTGVVERIEKDEFGKPIYELILNGKKERFAGIYFKDAKIGDKISMHLRCAIEKL